jgi:transcription elongation factor S-II
MAANSSELRTLVAKLQSASSDSEIKDILTLLKKETKVTEALLRESKAGLAVGKLRTHASADVSNLAKELVKKWKAEVDREKASRGDAGKGSAPSKKAGSKSTTPAPTTPVVASAPKPAAVASPAPKPSAQQSTRTAKSDGVKIDVLGDKTRDKCMELIYDALALDSGSPSDLILKRARAVEMAVFAANDHSTSANYKAKIRSLFVNLKDKANPGLRESVVSGDISAEKFANMTSAEMASNERKAEDEKIRADNLFGSLAAGEQEAETDAFQCGRCKQRKCRYRQAQTRSADEPMTTFVTCTNCGNRWKFS